MIGIILIADVAQEQELPWPVFLLVLVATVFLLIAARRGTRRSAERASRGSSRMAADYRKQHRLDDDLREVMLELESLARSVNAQIENKYQKLEAVIRHADERIQRLEMLAGAPERGRPSATEERSLDVTVAEEGVVHGASTGHSELGILSDSERLRVYELSDSGMLPQMVAKELGRTTAEIELLLALKRSEQ